MAESELIGGMREGETVLDFDPAERAEAGVVFIGRVRTPWSPEDCPRNIRTARERGEAATLEIFRPYRPGLTGLEAGQHVMALYWMDRKRRDLIVQKPGHADGPRGVFALRSPVRPNPIAMSCARIVAIDIAAGLVTLDALDCWDGTPLVDLKPWLPTVDAPPEA
jgi:tRNA-Thr(GGU) m(6)t(6)A37 methyltransferase TsaA